MSKKVPINIGDKGFERILREAYKAQKELKAKTDVFIERLAEIGLNTARVEFKGAKYAGDNDVEVNVDKRGNGTIAVVASGNATLFIEFGTGITYPDNHPEKPDGILGRGEYGKGHGKRKAWGYYGDPGNMEPVHTGPNGLVVTRGNQANQCMYKAEKEIENRVREIAREVFR